MHAVRNIRLCTKDCLCLYVCPTGATDTEDGQIDAEKCLSGCRACVDACPSHAISLVPEEYPAPQEKTEEVKEILVDMMDKNSSQIELLDKIARDTDDAVLRQLAVALSKSSALVAEDFIRESGFLLPQGKETKKLLKAMLTENSDGFPVEEARRLLELL